MSIEKVDFEAACYDNADHILRNKLNQIIDAVTALQEYCMPGFKGEISKCGWCGCEAQPDFDPDDERKYIYCENNDCDVDPSVSGKSKKIVIKMWNSVNDQA